ncbi:hypothetical protein GCM10029978_011860 [Actinoallomurus acanthiterrae]
MQTDPWPYRSDFARRHYFRGLAEAFAESLAEAFPDGAVQGVAKKTLELLKIRGVPVPFEASERITACTDLVQLTDWLARAGVIRSVDDLFTPDPGCRSVEVGEEVAGEEVVGEGAVRVVVAGEGVEVR